MFKPLNPAVGRIHPRTLPAYDVHMPTAPACAIVIFGASGDLALQAYPRHL